MAYAGQTIVVAGNIATGKTGLLEALAPALDLPTFPERWEENPWFVGEAVDPFAAEMWFLLAAASDQARALVSGGIHERSLHEHALVFARDQLMGIDAEILMRVYGRLDERLPDPQLLIYLDAPAERLLERVRDRRRAPERGLTLARLRKLGASYRALISAWTRSPVLEIDTSRVDLRTHEGVTQVVEQARARLRGEGEPS
jgi:deoxyguanosine kinase